MELVDINGNPLFNMERHAIFDWEEEDVYLGVTRGGVANALDHVCVTSQTVPASVSKQLPETLAKSEKEGGENLKKTQNYKTHY